MLNTLQAKQDRLPRRQKYKIPELREHSPGKTHIPVPANCSGYDISHDAGMKGDGVPGTPPPLESKTKEDEFSRTNYPSRRLETITHLPIKYLGTDHISLNSTFQQIGGKLIFS